jgi:hypothetical protein
MEQNSIEWHEARGGMFTSSKANDLICTPKKKPRPYIMTRLAERVRGESLDVQFTNASIEWGIHNEPLAARQYARRTGATVEKCGFITHPSMYYFGGSPDRLIVENGKPGILEIKCPDTHTHLQHCLIDSVDFFKKNYADKYWQCVSNMVITGSDFYDFVSFDPRVDADAGLFIFRVPYMREEADIVLNAVRKAEQELCEVAERIGVTDLNNKWIELKKSLLTTSKPA